MCTEEGGKKESTPVADDKGVARTNEDSGRRRALRKLEALRRGKRAVSFETNAQDLQPGVVFTIERHPQTGKDVLITDFAIAGSPTDVWQLSGQGVFVDVQYRPARSACR